MERTLNGITRETYSDGASRWADFRPENEGYLCSIQQDGNPVNLVMRIKAKIKVVRIELAWVEVEPDGTPIEIDEVIEPIEEIEFSVLEEMD